VGRDSLYDLNPSDIINEEDYEESSMGDQLSALKRKSKDPSLLGYSLRKTQTGRDSVKDKTVDYTIDSGDEANLN